MAMEHEQNMAVVRRIVEAIWNRGELAAADALFTADYSNHGGLIPDLVCGPEAIKVAVALYRTAFPALHVTIEELRVEGETVILRWTARDSAAPAPDADTAADNQGSLAGTTRGRLVGGQIAESWTDWDATRIMGQWGHRPPRGNGELT